MTIAKCTENGSNPPMFDLTLVEGGDERGKIHGPYIDFLIFPKNVGGGNIPTSAFFYVELEDLFKEFMKTYWNNSHGELTPPVIKMLREYADKLEQDLESRNK